ncbi:hypothetical protein Q5752_000775 [Cryptotrichosporon argae]
MSLYADDDLDATFAVDAVSTSAAAPVDPVQALTEALSLPAESAEQADALAAAGARFEERPEKLPNLCTQLLPMVADGGESLLRAWTLDMVALAVGRSSLKAEIKMAVAQASLESLDKLLQSNSVQTLRALIPIFSTIHPLLFRLLASSTPPPFLLQIFNSAKARIIALALDPNAQPSSVGVKAAAWKFVQKVLLVGTRAGGGDPRLARGGSDVSIGMIGQGSSLSVAQLEEEAQMLRTQVVTQLYASTDPAILHAIMNTFPALCKARPTLAPLLVSSVVSWTPAALDAAGRPPMQVRAVEKTLRSVMAHLARHPSLVAYSIQLADALNRQKQRMEAAALVVAELKAQRRAAAKHPLPAESSAEASKRARVEEARPSDVDVASLPADAVVQGVFSALRAMSVESINRAFDNVRRSIANNEPGAPHALAIVLGLAQPEPEVKVDDDMLNPLEMELDDEDDLLLQPLEEDQLNEIAGVADFHLPAPGPLDDAEKRDMADSAVQRIWDAGAELASLGAMSLSDAPRTAVRPNEMWMLLLARMASRGGEDRRRLLGDFIVKDFVSRAKFAAVWLNEEWLAKRRFEPNQYDSGLDAIVRACVASPDTKDASLSSFLLSLPEIPAFVVDAIEPLCVDTERMLAGFLALRDFAEHRPPVRRLALGRLLELCTHDERKVRVMAITTVRRWVPSSAMAGTIVAYALGVLGRLATGDAKPDAETPPPDMPAAAASRFLGAVTPDTVQQHVELAFALSRRHQDMLDDIFRLYPRMAADIQDALESLLTPLIQSLGANKKLLDILKTFPPGADKLAVRVMAIMSAGGSSPVLVSLVRSLMNERDLDPRFIIPVLGELDKAEIETQIPNLVKLLGTPDGRDVVRTAFASALQKMTPADLLVCLHRETGDDKQPALKQTVEAIGICFSMTTVFRSDVLATAMQRIVDLPAALPVCFVRTVIQAVTTYKSLVPFIANNVLPKLVARRVWDAAQLWDGVVRLVGVLGHASFGAMMQMPVEQIRDVVDKKPTLRQPLKAYLASKPAAKSQLALIFGDE